MKKRKIQQRKTQEQRRRETREAVLNAAAQVLTEAGYASFSAARVATQAGVSRGALERYFPTKNDLLVAVTGHVMDRAMSDARLLAARGPKQGDPINRFLLDSEHFFFSPVYRGMIELAIAAKGDDDLAERYDPIVMRARRELNATWLEALADAGFPRRNAELFVELTHYFLRGLFLVSTWLPYKPNRRALLEAWSELAPGILRVGETFADPASGRRLAKAPQRARAGLKKKA
jgi:AcrR family transcriptional regulator